MRSAFAAGLRPKAPARAASKMKVNPYQQATLNFHHLSLNAESYPTSISSLTELTLEPLATSLFTMKIGPHLNHLNSTGMTVRGDCIHIHYENSKLGNAWRN